MEEEALAFVFVRPCPDSSRACLTEPTRRRAGVPVTSTIIVMLFDVGQDPLAREMRAILPVKILDL